MRPWLALNSEILPVAYDPILNIILLSSPASIILLITMFAYVKYGAKERI